MKNTSRPIGSWDWLLAQVEAVVDLDGVARETGALVRRNKVRDGTQLFRLALMYGPGGLSLRGAAALAEEIGVPSLSDKAVLGRLRKCGPMLERVLLALLAERGAMAAAAEVGDLELSLVDGSLICSSRRRDVTWRLHASYDPGRGRFSDLVVTDSKVAERIDRTQIRPAAVVVADRGYARVRDFNAVLADRADFVTRLGWRSVRLRNADGTPVDPLGELPCDGCPRERVVHVAGVAQPLRLIIAPLPPEKAAAQRKKVARKASKKSHRLDPRTTQAAGYLMLLTSLPAERQSTEAVLSIYRQRWQIELGFKRLKSLGDIDGLPTADPDLTRTWLLAHLIAAVLTEDLANQILDFSPCGWPPETPLDLADLQAGTRDDPPCHRPPAAHPRQAPLATTAPQPG
jgi:hypothetical protein